MAQVDPHEPVVEGPYNVEFNTSKGSQYLTCVACGWLTLWTTCIGLPLLPCIPYWASKNIHSQICVIDDKRMSYKSGWINKSDQLIPLDRIQDINIVNGCMARSCGVSVVNIQTAGAGGPNPEASLLAPLNPAQLRHVIMAKRDALVLGHNLAAGGGVDSMKGPTPTPGMVAELSRIGSAVERIEKQIERGLTMKH